MKKVLVALFMVLFLCTSAQAITYGFDPTGLDGVSGYDQLGGFKFVGVGGQGKDTENAPAGGNGLLDLWTETNLATKTFTENFTLQLLGGLNGYGSLFTYYNTDNIFLDVNLSGTIGPIAGDGSYTAYFTGGNAALYVDSVSNHDFDAGETVIASLEYNNSLPFSFEPSLLGGAAISVDIGFVFLTAADAFWDDAFQSIVEQGFMLSMTQGDLTLREIIAGDPMQYLGWTVIAVDSDFVVVPEPTTMLLFGIGLLGLAGVSRSRKKRS